MSTTNSPPSTELDVFLSHLYTPYGVAVTAVIAAILASLLWTIGCCVYCCCKRRYKQGQAGVSEANRELSYYGMGSTEQLESSTTVQGGTMSSGYNTGPPVSTISIHNDGSSYHLQSSSMDSILRPNY